MIPAASLAIVAALLFFGSMLQGIIGFGMGLFTAAFILRLMPLSLYVPVVISLALCMNAELFLQLRRNADFKIILPLLIGTALGVWPGTYLPDLVPTHVMKIALGVLIIISGIVLWTGWKYETHRFLPRVLVGFTSGALAGSVSISAPVIAIFLTAGNTPKHIFRASTSAFLLAQNVITTFAFITRGKYTPDHLKTFLWLLPAVLLGTFCGSKIAGKVNEGIFRKAVMVLIIISGVTLLF